MESIRSQDTDPSQRPDEVVAELVVDVPFARVYSEGWQSWSPATWYPADASGESPLEDWRLPHRSCGRAS